MPVQEPISLLVDGSFLTQRYHCITLRYRILSGTHCSVSTMRLETWYVQYAREPDSTACMLQHCISVLHVVWPNAQLARVAIMDLAC